MYELFKVAFRNVGRNKRRTVITMITVLLGVIVTTMTRGLLNGLQGEIQSGLTRKIHGDLQIHKQGYKDSLESNPYHMLVPFTPDSVASWKHIPGVEEVTPRLKVMALLNHQKSQTTTPVLLMGIHSPTEQIVCPRLSQTVQQGVMLDSTKEISSGILEDDDLRESHGLGSHTTPGSPATDRSKGHHQIMLTPSLMRGLHAEVGDELVVLFQDKDNMQQALVAQLTAVLDYGLPNQSARIAWMDIGSLQETLHLHGEVSEVAFKTSGDVPIIQVRQALTHHLSPDLIAETWLDIAGFFRDTMAIQETIFNSILIIMFVIVISAIVNTSLMTVMERTREIGTLMALGYRRKHILFLFLTESALIGMFGGTIGVCISVVLLALMQHWGIAMVLPAQTIPTILYPYVPHAFIALVLVLSFLSAVIAGFIPAYRASCLKPVQALTAL